MGSAAPMTALARRIAVAIAFASAIFALSVPGTASARPHVLPKLPLGRAAGASVPLPIPQPFAGLAPVSFKYWGGPIMSVAENENVLWGNSGHNTTLTSNLPSFLTAFATAGNSNPYNVALEYQTAGRTGTTTNQRITIASRYLGTATISPSTPSTTLDDTDVQDELIHQITIGALPAPRVAFGGPVTEYYVMFPPAYTVCIGSDCSDVDFCAYHSDAHFGGIPFTYAVLPESTPTDPGCGASSSPGTGNLDSMTSHEMVESMTDPEVGDALSLAPPLAWYDATNGEVADICNGQEASATFGGFTWTVQEQWSNTNKTCEATHPFGGLQGVSASFAPSTSLGPVGFEAGATTTPNTGATVSQYAWDWGDGTSSSGSSAVVGHSYATPGTRLVMMIASDSSGASGASFLSVTTRNLSVSSAHGQVTSSPGGISCGGSCSANFLDGTSVSLTATPDTGFSFGGWSGDCAGQPATCVVALGGARAATANFTSFSPPPPPPSPPSPPPPPPPPPPAACIVPAVKGKSLAGASTSLQVAHCKTGAIRRRYSSRVRKGRVISQGVVAGTKLANGAGVSLVVSKGRAPVRMTICYHHRTLHVTKAVATKLRKRGATLGPCRRR
jgi:hypothetical protein